jgi:hypothetical protein
VLSSFSLCTYMYYEVSPNPCGRVRIRYCNGLGARGLLLTTYFVKRAHFRVARRLPLLYVLLLDAHKQHTRSRHNHRIIYPVTRAGPCSSSPVGQMVPEVVNSSLVLPQPPSKKDDDKIITIKNKKKKRVCRWLVRLRCSG